MGQFGVARIPRWIGGFVRDSIAWKRQFAERAESSVAARRDRDPKPERAEEGIETLEFRVALGGEGSVERRRIEVCRLGNRGYPTERLGDAPEWGLGSSGTENRVKQRG